VACKKLLVDQIVKLPPFYQGPIIFGQLVTRYGDFRGSGFPVACRVCAVMTASPLGVPNYLDHPEGICAPTPISDRISSSVWCCCFSKLFPAQADVLPLSEDDPWPFSLSVPVYGLEMGRFARLIAVLSCSRWPR